MILKNYEVTLRQMSEDDLEMVLKWRNSEHIKKYAISKEIISLQQHKKWFESLKLKGDLYFVVESNKKPVGLIWANRFQKNGCETGMYIYDTNMQNTLFPYKVSLILNEYLFKEKKLDSISCEILNENSRSMRFTLSLGYKELQKKEEITEYILTKEDFEPHRIKIKKLLTKSSNR